MVLPPAAARSLGERRRRAATRRRDDVGVPVHVDAGVLVGAEHERGRRVAGAPELLPEPPPLLDPELLPLLDRSSRRSCSPLLEPEPLPPPPGHVVPPGSQPVPQLTVWQCSPGPRCPSSTRTTRRGGRRTRWRRCPCRPTRSGCRRRAAAAAAGAAPAARTRAAARALPLDPLLPPLPPLPLPEHCTGSHSAGTDVGVHPGSLVCAWTHGTSCRRRSRAGRPSTPSTSPTASRRRTGWRRAPDCRSSRCHPPAKSSRDPRRPGPEAERCAWRSWSRSRGTGRERLTQSLPSKRMFNSAFSAPPPAPLRASGFGESHTSGTMHAATIPRTQSASRYASCVDCRTSWR